MSPADQQGAPLLLDEADVMHLLKLPTKWAVLSLCRNRKLPYVIVARKRRFRPQDVQQFVEGLGNNGRVP